MASSLATDLLDGPFPELAMKAPVRVATTGPVALFGLQTIDGVAVEYGDRVLAKDQTDPRQNGIWIASQSVWRRASDADGAYDLTNGTRIRVQQGAVWARETFVFVGGLAPIVGVSDLVFVAESLEFAQTLIANVLPTSLARPRIAFAQKPVSQLKLTDANGDPLFTSATRAPQGACGIEWNGVRYVIRKQRVTGEDDDPAGEYFRLMTYLHTEPGAVEIAPIGFTSAQFKSGHQALSGFVDGVNQVWLWTTCKNGSGVDPFRRKGLQRIKFDLLNPSVTTDADLTEVRLIPATGPMANFYGDTGGVSDDGKYLWMALNHGQAPNRSDGVRVVMLWDRVEAETLAAANAGDASAARPLAAKVLHVPSELDAEAWQDGHQRGDGVLFLASGSTMGQGQHYLLQTDVFRPHEPPAILKPEGARCQYTPAELLNHPTYGILTLETEGVWQFPSDPDTTYFLEQEVWYDTSGAKVSWAGSNWIAKDNSTGTEPGSARAWQLTSLAPTEAWNRLTAYLGTTNVTRRRTNVTKVFPATGAVGEFPLNRGNTGFPSPATIALGDNAATFSTQTGKGMSFWEHSVLSNDMKIFFSVARGDLKVYDTAGGFDPSFGRFRRFRQTDALGQRGYLQVSADGHFFFNFWDLDDAVNPGLIELFHHGVRVLDWTEARGLRMDRNGTGWTERWMRTGVAKGGAYVSTNNVTLVGAAGHGLQLGYSVAATPDVVVASWVLGNELNTLLPAGSIGPAMDASYDIGSDALRVRRVRAAQAAFNQMDAQFLPGPYADDAAAATAGVAVNSVYRKTGGSLAWRVA